MCNYAKPGTEKTRFLYRDAVQVSEANFAICQKTQTN